MEIHTPSFRGFKIDLIVFLLTIALLVSVTRSREDGKDGMHHLESPEEATRKYTEHCNEILRHDKNDYIHISRYNAIEGLNKMVGLWKVNVPSGDAGLVNSFPANPLFYSGGGKASFEGRDLLWRQMFTSKNGPWLAAAYARRSKWGRSHKAMATSYAVICGPLSCNSSALLLRHEKKQWGYYKADDFRKDDTPWKYTVGGTHLNAYSQAMEVMKVETGINYELKFGSAKYNMHGIIEKGEKENFQVDCGHDDECVGRVEYFPSSESCPHAVNPYNNIPLGEKSNCEKDFERKLPKNIVVNTTDNISPIDGSKVSSSGIKQTLNSFVDEENIIEPLVEHAVLLHGGVWRDHSWSDGISHLDNKRPSRGDWVIQLALTIILFAAEIASVVTIAHHLRSVERKMLSSNWGSTRSLGVRTDKVFKVLTWIAIPVWGLFLALPFTILGLQMTEVEAEVGRYATSSIVQMNVPEDWIGCDAVQDSNCRLFVMTYGISTANWEKSYAYWFFIGASFVFLVGSVSLALATKPKIVRQWVIKEPFHSDSGYASDISLPSPTTMRQPSVDVYCPDPGPIVYYT